MKQRFMCKGQMWRPFVFIGVLFTLVSSVYPFASSRWMYKNSRHFQVAFNQETAHLVDRTLYLAENIADTLAHYFGYTLDKEKISIVLYDETDNSNGSANEMRPIVRIYCRKTPILWRGETEWLRTVLSHELSHIFSLDVMRSPFKLSLGTLWHSDQDVNDGEIDTRIESRQVPTWFIEGVAQLGSYEFGTESRDPFREMLLRDAWINNRLLSLPAMSRFEGTSREYELVYNQGFDLVLFLKTKIESDNFIQLCKQIRQSGFKNAIEKSFGKTVDALYEEWREVLSQRYNKLPDAIPGKPVFSPSDRPLTMVMTCIGNNRYVISNRLHDYTRFDLFKVEPDNGRYRLIASDVYPVLSRDPRTGTIWFAREGYNKQSGVQNYDLYEIEKSGKIRRETRGERSIAFDVRDGHLVYAAYDKGVTRIVRKNSDGLRTELYSFPYDTAVYRLSILSPDSIIVSLGAGTNSSVALLTGNTLRDLWPNQEGHTMDAVAAGRDTLLFVSTLNGAPQLYWCDLQGNSAQWYRITNAIGVMQPTVEWDNGHWNVYCSAYEKGNFSVYQLDSPFNRDYPVVMQVTESAIDKSKLYVNESLTDFPKRSIRMPLGPPGIYLGFENRSTSSVDADGSTEVTKRIGPAISGNFTLANAPGSFGIGLSGNSFFPFNLPTVKVGGLDVGIDITRDIWQTKTTLTYANSMNTQNTFEDEKQYSLLKSAQRELGSVVDYQLSDRQFLYIGYKLRWRRVKQIRKVKDSRVRYTLTGSSTIEKDFGTTDISNRYIFSWMYQNYRSQFDPAHLGSSGTFVQAKTELHANRYPNDTVSFNDTTWYVYYGDNWHTDPILGARLYVNAQKRLLFWNARASIYAQFHGYNYLNNIVKGKMAPRMHEYIGGEGLFSGYPDYYVKVDQLEHFEFEMRFNPLVTNLDNTQFFERFHLSAKIETGFARYYHEGKSGWFQPTTSEIALRFYWYLRSRVQSSAYLKYAFPISEVNIGKPSKPYRIYFGMTL